MIRVFIGWDARQPIAGHVLCSSILRHSSVPISITPLILDTLPITRKGLTDFTFARYLVPWLCDYEGTGIFMDSDMLITTDIARLKVEDPYRVALVAHGDHAYENTSMMVFNNKRCRMLTADYIEDEDPQALEWVGYLEEEEPIPGWGGDPQWLPPEWNFLIGYDKAYITETHRKIPWLIHYTQGIPEYKECRDCDYADLWFEEKAAMLHSVSWIEIMGRSVHADPVLSRLIG